MEMIKIRKISYRQLHIFFTAFVNLNLFYKDANVRLTKLGKHCFKGSRGN